MTHDIVPESSGGNSARELRERVPINRVISSQELNELFPPYEDTNISTRHDTTRESPLSVPSIHAVGTSLSELNDLLPSRKRSYAQFAIGLGDKNHRPASPFSRHSSPRNVPENNLAPIIAVMGRTGSGKSSFISTLATQNYTKAVGHNLVSETQAIHEVECKVNNRRIVLIDTPGFDDTNVETGTILKRIADWLQDSYDKNKLLTGLIYCHDITDSRFSGSSVRNMTLFEKLTGQDSMKNVILMSTKWDSVDQETAERRELELKNTTGFWKIMLSDGAQAMRHNGTPSAAEQVILGLLDRQPAPIRIQEELAQGMRIRDTAAGAYIDHEIIKLQNIHRQEMNSLKQQIETAEKKNKVDLTRTLQEQYEKIMMDFSHMQSQREALLDERFRATEQKIHELGQRTLQKSESQKTHGIHTTFQVPREYTEYEIGTEKERDSQTERKTPETITRVHGVSRRPNPVQMPPVDELASVDNPPSPDRVSSLLPSLYTGWSTDDTWSAPSMHRQNTVPRSMASLIQSQEQFPVYSISMMNMDRTLSAPAYIPHNTQHPNSVPLLSTDSSVPLLSTDNTFTKLLTPSEEETLQEFYRDSQLFPEGLPSNYPEVSKEGSPSTEPFGYSY